jgi:hypothetical protein
MLPVDQDTKPVRTISAGGQPYISLRDAAQIYRVSLRTIYNWMDSGTVQFAYAPGGSRYLLLSSLALRLPNGERIDLDVPPSRYQFMDVR